MLGLRLSRLEMLGLGCCDQPAVFDGIHGDVCGVGPSLILHRLACHDVMQLWCLEQRMVAPFTLRTRVLKDVKTVCAS